MLGRMTKLFRGWTLEPLPPNPDALCSAKGCCNHALVRLVYGKKRDGRLATRRFCAGHACTEVARRLRVGPLQGLWILTIQRWERAAAEVRLRTPLPLPVRPR